MAVLSLESIFPPITWTFAIDGADRFYFYFSEEQTAFPSSHVGQRGGLVGNPALLPAVHSAVGGELGETTPLMPTVGRGHSAEAGS